jgi:DNA-dependent RNA polymerase auxiliary subunit epsilon
VSLLRSFKKWINENTEFLQKKGIRTEKIYMTDDCHPTKGAYVDHCTNKYIGRLSVSDEGYVDIEIIEIVSETRIMIAHYEKQKELFPDLVLSYVRILES